MKLELTKEIRKGEEWYCIYINGEYHTSFMTLGAARLKFDILKNSEGKDHKETIETWNSDEIPMPTAIYVSDENGELKDLTKNS